MVKIISRFDVNYFNMILYCSCTCCYIFIVSDDLMIEVYKRICPLAAAAYFRRSCLSLIEFVTGGKWQYAGEGRKWYKLVKGMLKE